MDGILKIWLILSYDFMKAVDFPAAVEYNSLRNRQYAMKGRDLK